LPDQHLAQLPNALGVIGHPHAPPSLVRIQFAGW
jgi:hypothetical protein